MILVCEKCEADSRHYDWACIGCKARARIYFRHRDADHTDRTVVAKLDRATNSFHLDEFIEDE